MGEQLRWKGLIAEVTTCGPCQATVNHPSAEFIRTAICMEDGPLGFDLDEQMDATFCPKHVDCELASSTAFGCRSLRSIFKERGITWVDFLSLDIEEYTPAAWHSVDHSASNIRVAVVENWPNISIDRNIYEYIEKNGDYFIWKKSAFKLVNNPCEQLLAGLSLY